MDRALLIVHAICAFALVGATTHELIWSLRYLRGQYGRARQERFFLNTATVLFAVTFVLGLVLYPPYKRDIRVGWLDLHHPHVGRLFDIKEHAVAMVLACLLAQGWLSRHAHPEDQRGPWHLATYVGLASLNAGLVWFALIVGLYTVSYRTFGGP